MFKPEILPYKTMFGKRTGKYKAVLFGVEAIGNSKEEAKQFLFDIIQWRLKDNFVKVFSNNGHIYVLYRFYNVNQYSYDIYHPDGKGGSYTFNAKNDNEAIRITEDNFNSMLEVI